LTPCGGGGGGGIPCGTFLTVAGAEGFVNVNFCGTNDAAETYVLSSERRLMSSVLIRLQTALVMSGGAAIDFLLYALSYSPRLLQIASSLVGGLFVGGGGRTN
jgi:hypothetical protein